MTDIQLVIMIALAAVGIALTRFLPFLVFSSDKPTPKYLVYLGKVLPPAVFGMLVVYCLKDLSFALPSGYLGELIAIFVTVIIHLCFRKMLLSVTGGLIVYVLLVNLVFV